MPNDDCRAFPKLAKSAFAEFLLGALLQILPIMRTLLVTLVFGLLPVSVHADDATPTLGPANLVHLRVVGDDRGAPPIPYGNRMVAPLIFEFADHRVKTLDEFKAAILALPRGTELRWAGDCISYTDLPLSGPVTAIADVQAFCAAHGVTFHYMPGGY